MVQAKVIGIIGGGQLARMLSMAALRLGFKVHILDPLEDAPARSVATSYSCASYSDFLAIEQFAQNCDILTYEFENISLEALRSLSCPIFPPLNALEISQDRCKEKSFCNQLGIATVDWAVVENLPELENRLAAFGGRGLLKTQRFGYDGHGQYAVSLKTASDVWPQVEDKPVILEKFTPFMTEISVIAARNAAGQVVMFDVVENLHEQGILRVSKVPAVIPAAVACEAKAVTTKLLEALGYVGVIAVEFFVLDQGQLVVNEFAPRVHNSGHWTEAAVSISQFEQHIRAIAGLPLVLPYRHSDCEMVNLLGEGAHDLGRLWHDSKVCLHLYGKEETRPRRKMGHFTRLTAPAGNRT